MSIYNLSTEETQRLLSGLEKSRIDHMRWLNNLNHFLIFGTAEQEIRLGHTECDFSKFYFTVSDEILLNNLEFISIKSTHQDMHYIANKLIDDYRSAGLVQRQDYELLVRLQIEFMQDLDDVYSFIQQTHHSMDNLTTLPNKAFMLSILEKEHARLKREREEGYLIFADIDHFKNVNDQHGHAAGDVVLMQVALILKNSFRKYDTVARFGGEEFVIFLAKQSLDSALAVVERARLEIEKMTFDLEGKSIIKQAKSLNITCSFGLARFCSEFSLKDNLKHSDKALYNAKANGRNRIEVFCPAFPS